MNSSFLNLYLEITFMINKKKKKKKNEVPVGIEKKIWIHQNCILSIFLCRDTIVILYRTI